MSQNTEILKYLKAGNTLTSLEALNRFGCFRLASRITDLKKTHNIKSEMVKVNSGKKVAQYSMVPEGMMF